MPRCLIVRVWCLGIHFRVPKTPGDSGHVSHSALVEYLKQSWSLKPVQGTPVFKSSVNVVAVSILVDLLWWVGREDKAGNIVTFGREQRLKNQTEPAVATGSKVRFGDSKRISGQCPHCRPYSQTNVTNVRLGRKDLAGSYRDAPTFRWVNLRGNLSVSV